MLLTRGIYFLSPLQMIIAIVGSSGLIGGHLLEAALNEKVISKIILLNRKPIGVIDLKTEEHIVDFGNDEQIKIHCKRLK